MSYRDRGAASNEVTARERRLLTLRDGMERFWSTARSPRRYET